MSLSHSAKLARVRELVRLMDGTRAMPPTCFPKVLGVRHDVQRAADAVGGGYSSWDSEGCHFGYTVPAHACVEAGEHFPLSGVLAVIDEVTTLGAAYGGGADDGARGRPSDA